MKGADEMTLDIEEIVELYRTIGAARYGMEAISQERHALQCGLLAEQAGSCAELVAAALLHDLGHLLAPDSGPDGARGNDLHEVVAIPFLCGAFGAGVIEPIRLHVDAKRYLCAVATGYWDTLSPASKRSLDFQGGAFTIEEAMDFIAQPYAMDAVALRRWDDCAKSPTRATPGWAHYREVLAGAQAVVAAQPRSIPRLFTKYLGDSV
jgi:phosphonate degradation associated HDIG domain protein